MNLRELKIFITVCETKNMSAAAKKLYMTQPAISQTISALEDKLNLKLFDRLNRSLKLTYPGKVLLNYSKRILNLINETKNAMDDISNLDQGQLRIGSSMTIGTYLLPQIIEEFQQKYEDVDLPFIIDNTSVIEQMVLDNKIDLGLVEGPINSDNIVVEKFFADQLQLVCSTKHKWSHWKSLSPEKINEEDFIMREEGSGTRKVIENILTNSNISYHITHVFNNIEAIKKAVAANIGISILPEISTKEERKKGKITKVNISGIEFTRNFSIIYHKDKYRSEIFNKFIEHL